MFFPLIPPVFAAPIQDVVMSQVLPNPTGDDTESEWIELENTSSSSVSLNGWSLSDGYGSVSSFSLDGLSIPAHAYLTLLRPDTGIVLNNDAEKVILKDSSGGVVETGIMSKSPEGKAYVFHDGIWEWLDPIAHTDSTPTQPPPSPTSPPTPFPSSSPNSNQPQPTQKPSSAIILNEVVACGSNPEWIELKNISNMPILLDGWSLSSSKVTIMKLDGVRIDPNALYTAWLPGFYLKNLEDTVKLLEKGTIRDQFAYDSCNPKSSWSRDDDGHWYATQTITQGTPNVFEQKEIEKEVEKKITLPKQQTPTIQTQPNLPELFLETPQPTSHSSAILGVTHQHIQHIPFISPLLLIIGGAFMVISQYKIIKPFFTSILNFVRATIERI